MCITPKAGAYRLAAATGTTHHPRMEEFTVRPQPDDPRLTRNVSGIDQERRSIMCITPKAGAYRLAAATGTTHHPRMEEFTVRPQPDDPRLTRNVSGLDQEGRPIETTVVVERPLTLFLNGQEIVTMMTVGDHPDYLAVGYLLNQNMLRPDDTIIAIDYDEDLETVVVRTDRETDFENKLKQEDADLGLRPGHGVRRSDGELR